MRQSFAARFPDVYGKGSEITRKELVQGVEEESTHNFFLSVYTPVKKWNDLDKDDSIWRLTLTDGERSVEASEITKLRVDANLTKIYPHISDYDFIYLVRFPRSDETNSALITPESDFFKVRIASSLGVAHLDWEIEK